MIAGPKGVALTAWKEDDSIQQREDSGSLNRVSDCAHDGMRGSHTESGGKHGVVRCIEDEIAFPSAPKWG